MAKLLPRQEWDEINVSHDRVKSSQDAEATKNLTKKMDKILKAISRKGKRK